MSGKRPTTLVVDDIVWSANIHKIAEVHVKHKHRSNEMNEEKFKAYDANYLISSHGRVWSVRRQKFLSQFEDGYGYLMVTIYHKTLKVHRLVALTFLDKTSNELLTVNHIDGDKINNRLDNLEWLSSIDNIKHAFNTGLMPKSSEIHTAKLTDDDVLEIKKLFVEYRLGDTQIGEQFGVDNSTISNIRRGISWKEVGKELIFNNKSPTGRGISKKLSGEDIPKIRQLSKEGHSNAAIGKIFKVNGGTIYGIINGNTWKNY